jgi:O-antigen/teichoic acid export membrane protein
MTNASWNALFTLWSIVISFVLAPLLIHKLGTGEYGLLLLVWSFTGILGLVGFGFGEATLRYIAHYFGEDDIGGVNRIMGATLTLYLAICGAVAVGLSTGAPVVVQWLSVPDDQRIGVIGLLRLSALIWAIRAIFVTHSSVLMALQRYDLNTKLGVGQSLLRAGGYVGLALTGFGVFHLVLWEAISQAVVFIVQIFVLRRVAPGVRLLPSLSFKGLPEIAGFSLFSFLTYGFLMMQRESGKMILAAKLGTAPVAYLGTPDNVAHRIHMVVASGSETLMPRFSANRDPGLARSLLANGTWSALVLSLVFLVPLIVLMPDFLRLWISPEFALESAVVGQWVALAYITQGAYTPVATFFRGRGQPSRVTLVVACAGLITLTSSVWLIPRHGVVGVGYAYVLGAVPSLVGLIHAWFHVFGRGSLPVLLRVVALPLFMAAAAGLIQYLIRSVCGIVSWMGLLALGGLFFAIACGLIFGADWTFGGGECPSRQCLRKLCRSEKLMFLQKLLPFRRMFCE